MKVILRQSHENLGRPGDEVEVKPGYARNFLVPQGIAYPLNRFYKKMFESERDALLKADAAARVEAEAVAGKGDGVEIDFEVKIGDRGKMFGAITSANIAEALAEKGIEVDRRKIALPSPLNTTGEHNVVVKPHGDVVFNVKVTLTGIEAKGQLRTLSIRELVDGETGEIMTEEAIEEAAENVGVEVVEMVEAADGDDVAEGEDAKAADADAEAPAEEAAVEEAKDEEEKAE